MKAIEPGCLVLVIAGDGDGYDDYVGREGIAKWFIAQGDTITVRKPKRETFQSALDAWVVKFDSESVGIPVNCLMRIDGYQHFETEQAKEISL